METEEPVDKTKSYVIMCNHQSSIDTLAMMQVRAINCIASSGNIGKKRAS